MADKTTEPICKERKNEKNRTKEKRKTKMHID